MMIDYHSPAISAASVIIKYQCSVFSKFDSTCSINIYCTTTTIIASVVYKC